MSDFLWVEKYRPKKISDCILSEDLKNTFSKFLDSKELPNLLLSGTAGTGKTTVARALCDELGVDSIIINGSDEGRHIDTLRTTIKNFASSVSLDGNSNHKVVIIDEADYMNPDSVQPALRNFIESFSKNCRFIFTCNYKNKIIPAIQSRCVVVNYQIKKEDKQKIAGSFLKRLEKILEAENLEYDTKVLAELIIRHYPDFRRTINELQRYSVRGKIDSGILVSISETNINNLVSSLKDKHFSNMRKWVADNIDKDSTLLFKEIYDKLYQVLEPQTIPHAVIILADYQYKSAFVADQELNMTACLTEIMKECVIK